MNTAEAKQKINEAKGKREVYAIAKEYGVKIDAETRKMCNLGGLKDHLAQQLGFDRFENRNF